MLSVLISYRELQFSDISYFHRPKKKKKGGIILLSCFLQAFCMDNRFGAHKDHLPFSVSRGFSSWSTLYFTLTLPTRCDWEVLRSTAPWFCACNRTIYACRDDAKLSPRLAQCRDGHFVDTHAGKQGHPCTLGLVCLKPIHSLAFHALYNYKQRENYLLLLSHKNLHAGLPQHLVLCRINK